jgi:hypothetical protein
LLSYWFLSQDLDELHAAFVEPLVERIKALVAHRKFIDDSKAMADEKVGELGATGTASPRWFCVPRHADCAGDLVQ